MRENLLVVARSAATDKKLEAFIQECDRYIRFGFLHINPYDWYTGLASFKQLRALAVAVRDLHTLARGLVRL